MPGKRPVASTESIETFPLRQWELDLGLHYADQKYEEEIDPDLLRIVFDTVQRRRTAEIRLHDLVRVVVEELVRESYLKRVAMRGAIGKINNNRRQLKEERRGATRSSAKQKDYPLDPVEKDQYTLLGTLKTTA